MRRLTSIVAVLLLLLAAAPMLACVTGAEMDEAGSACCRSMHGQCGEMAKQGCCRTEVRTDDSPQVAVSAPAMRVHWMCVAHLGLPSSPTPISLPQIARMTREHSPPGLLIATTTVLRI